MTVRRDYRDTSLSVNSFGSELSQVWTNLIDNAIDAMGGQGELRVRAYRDDGCVVVEIGDNGPGISPEVMPHIYEPFFTTEGSRRGHGTWTRHREKDHQETSWDNPGSIQTWRYVLSSVVAGGRSCSILTCFPTLWAPRQQ